MQAKHLDRSQTALPTTIGLQLQLYSTEAFIRTPNRFSFAEGIDTPIGRSLAASLDLLALPSR
jgi:hypothetical protein